jgi:iron complex transport system permease protein
MSRTTRCVVTCACAAALALLLAPLCGAEPIHAGRAWSELLGGAPAESSTDAQILALRLPRVLLAFLCGAALAASGATFQTLLRNPLAEPYTLGTAAAGSLGAFLVATLFSAGAAAMGGLGARLAALAFALAQTALVLQVARRSTRGDGLILAGVSLTCLCGAGIVLLRHLASPFDLAAMDRWMIGALDAVGFGPALGILPWVIGAGALLLARAQDFDQLAFDDEIARARGVNVDAARRQGLFAAAVMSAAVVAHTGPIGFVGLLVPHAVRPWIGHRHAPALLANALAGGALLVACDALARSWQLFGRGSELPVGAVTALLGAPLFLLLLTRRAGGAEAEA